MIHQLAWRDKIFSRAGAGFVCIVNTCLDFLQTFHQSLINHQNQVLVLRASFAQSQKVVYTLQAGWQETRNSDSLHTISARCFCGQGLKRKQCTAAFQPVHCRSDWLTSPSIGKLSVCVSHRQVGVATVMFPIGWLTPVVTLPGGQARWTSKFVNAKTRG